MAKLAMSINTMANRNSSLGHYFFTAGSMAFFKSKIYCDSNKYGLFITSEKNDGFGYKNPRYYTIRHISLDGHVSTISAFNVLTLYRAKKIYDQLTKCFDDAAKNYLDGIVINDMVDLQATYDEGIFNIYNSEGAGITINTNDLSRFIAGYCQKGIL